MVSDALAGRLGSQGSGHSGLQARKLVEREVDMRPDLGRRGRAVQQVERQAQMVERVTQHLATVLLHACHRLLHPPAAGPPGARSSMAERDDHKRLCEQQQLPFVKGSTACRRREIGDHGQWGLAPA
jgi:hypothetical protein